MMSFSSDLPRAQMSRRAQLAGGQPISELMSRALAHPEIISLAAGFVDQPTLPVQPTTAALEALLSDPSAARAALQYGTTPGYLPLREALRDQFLAQEGLTAAAAGLSVEQIVLTAGSNQLLHLVAETLLDPGDIVICSSPTYFVFLGTLQNLGARAVGIEADEAGVVPEALEQCLRQFQQQGMLGRVKAVYLVSYYDNPRGVSLTVPRRQELMRICARWSRHQRFYVIEDAAYRPLRYAGPDLPSLWQFDQDRNQVIVAGTFSKSFSPGLRVGWGILPSALIAPICSQKGNIDFGSPNFNQHLMAKVLERDLLQPHVQQICREYHQKLTVMLSACQRWLAPRAGVRWIRPEGGLYVWLELPTAVDTGPGSRLFDRAVAEGVLYVPGEFCFPPEGQPVRRNTLRLSFGVQSCERIELGIQALARAIAHVL